MNDLRLLLVPVTVLLASGWSSVQAQESPFSDTLAYIALNDPANATAVVARVGPTSITAREFLLSYEFGPSFTKQRSDAKRKYLEFMLNEKLLALGARERGRANDPRIKANLVALEGDVATEELYKRDILGKVRVSDAEVERAVAEQQTTLQIRWLYAQNEEEISTAARALRSGISFDTLFEHQLADASIMRADRMMESTAFKILQRNRALASVIDTLRLMRPSAPIQARDGWYVLQVDAAAHEPITTESALNRLRQESRRALTQMKADSLSDRYVREMMLGVDPVIQRRAFDMLRAYLGLTLLSKEKFENWGLADRFHGGNDSADYTHIDLHARETLVTLRRGRVTLGEFLQWYRLREAGISLRQTTPQSFFLSLEDLVWRMVRDRLLIERAKKRKLDTRQAVKLQSRWWADKMLYQIEKDSIMKTIRWSDSVLFGYYNEHLQSFKDTNGTVQPFERMKENVLREWYARELNTRMLRRIRDLKSRYAPSVDEELLKALPVADDNNPRAVQVYTVKKGGTFPHPAFPSIDEYWRLWI
jgi:hypothetical protein